MRRLFARRPGVGHEGRWQVGAQRDQVGAHAPGKIQIEMEVVFDRIELTVREKIEIAPIGIESGRDVAQHRPGDLPGFAGFEQRQLDDRGLLCDGKPIGQPAPIGRPGQPTNRAIWAAVEHAQGTLVEVNHQHFMAMVGQGDQVAVRRGRQIERASDVQPIQPHLRFFGGFGLIDFQRLFAGGVADDEQPLLIGQPGGQPAAGAVGGAILHDGLFPVGHTEDLAARNDGHTRTARMQVVVMQVAGGVHEFAIALHTHAVKYDLDALRLVAGRVEDE